MSGNRSRTSRSYDHRLSSSMAGRRPSHFFKIILPSTIDDKKLRIPEKFVREFGDELSAVATLTVPYDHICQVGLEKTNKEIWFGDGWQDFMENHCIHCGYFLVFRYEGNSKFHVLVFDNTATEIQYTWSKNCKLEDQVDTMDKLNKNEMCNSDKHEVGKGAYVRERSAKGRFMMSSKRERAIQAARMLKPKSPSFMAVLRPYHMRARRPLYVPVEFASKYLIGHQFVKLQTSDGKQWEARCYGKDHSSSYACNIGQGWTEFSKDNNLEEGDVCVLELIKKKPVVLNVSIFHVAD